MLVTDKHTYAPRSFHINNGRMILDSNVLLTSDRKVPFNLTQDNISPPEISQAHPIATSPPIVSFAIPTTVINKSQHNGISTSIYIVSTSIYKVALTVFLR